MSLFDDLSAMANAAEGGNAEQNNGADMLSALMSMAQGREQGGAADMFSAFLGGAGEEQQPPEGLAGILGMLSSDELSFLTSKLQDISFDAEGIQKLMADPELTETLSSKVLPLLQQLFLNRK